MSRLDGLDGRRASVFGGFAEEYERFRPGYPEEAVSWLLPPGASRVVDVGAGTGKLTGALLARGLQVVAVEPDPQMLAVLTWLHPGAEAELAGADGLPVPDHSVDAVLVAQAWHWFPHGAAVAEVRRVLRPGGRLGLLWNGPRPLEGWERALARLDPDRADAVDDPAAELPADLVDVPGLPADELEHLLVPWTWDITAAQLCAREATSSIHAFREPAERELLLDAHAAVVEQEARRSGTATVPLHQAAACVRWTPGEITRTGPRAGRLPE